MSALAARTGLENATATNASGEAALLALFDFVAQRLAAGTTGAGAASAAELKTARKSLGLGVSASIASSATMDFTVRTGNLVPVTGSASTTVATMINDDDFVCIAPTGWVINIAGVLSYTTVAGDLIHFKQVAGVQYANVLKKGQAPAFVDSPFEITTADSAGARTFTLKKGGWFFRNPTLGDGAMEYVKTDVDLTVTLSAGSTIGSANAVQSDALLRVVNDGGNLRLTVENNAGCMDASEMGVISTVAEGGAGGADSATTIYSTTAVTNKAYRIAGMVRSIQATAGTWATAPSLIQGIGGLALSALATFGFRQTLQNVSGSRVNGGTYTNTGPRVRWVFISGSSTGGSGAVTLNGNSLFVSLARSTYYNYMPIVFPVPPGWTYTTSNLDTISYWCEMD